MINEAVVEATHSRCGHVIAHCPDTSGSNAAGKVAKVGRLPSQGSLNTVTKVLIAPIENGLEQVIEQPRDMDAAPGADMGKPHDRMRVADKEICTIHVRLGATDVRAGRPGSLTSDSTGEIDNFKTALSVCLEAKDYLDEYSRRKTHETF